jgi:hypothetical protein
MEANVGEFLQELVRTSLKIDQALVATANTTLLSWALSETAGRWPLARAA